jgi:hypothetical protein
MSAGQSYQPQPTALKKVGTPLQGIKTFSLGARHLVHGWDLTLCTSSLPGGMSQYPIYGHQQPPNLQPGPRSYAPPSAYYGSYGYPSGLTSPQDPGHPVSSSLGPQMGSSWLPLPRKCTGLSPASAASDSCLRKQICTESASFSGIHEQQAAGTKPVYVHS